MRSRTLGNDKRRRESDRSGEDADGDGDGGAERGAEGGHEVLVAVADVVRGAVGVAGPDAVALSPER